MLGGICVLVSILIIASSVATAMTWLHWWDEHEPKWCNTPMGGWFSMSFSITVYIILGITPFIAWLHVVSYLGQLS